MEVIVPYYASFILVESVHFSEIFVHICATSRTKSFQILRSKELDGLTLMYRQGRVKCFKVVCKYLQQLKLAENIIDRPIHSAEQF